MQVCITSLIGFTHLDYLFTHAAQISVTSFTIGRVKTEQGISVKTWTKLQVGLNVNFSFKTSLSVCL